MTTKIIELTMQEYANLKQISLVTVNKQVKKLLSKANKQKE
jgi:hypothetical protein